MLSSSWSNITLLAVGLVLACHRGEPDRAEPAEPAAAEPVAAKPTDGRIAVDITYCIP